MSAFYRNSPKADGQLPTQFRSFKREEIMDIEWRLSGPSFDFQHDAAEAQSSRKIKQMNMSEIGVLELCYRRAQDQVVVLDQFSPPEVHNVPLTPIHFSAK